MGKDRIELIDLILIKERGAIATFFPLMRKGIEAIQQKSHDESIYHTVVNGLGSGFSQLWILFIGGIYQGFAITQIASIGPGKKELYISQVFINKNVSKEALSKGLEVLEDYAKREGCARLTFKTVRSSPILRRLASMNSNGWQESYVEICKETNNGRQ